MDGGVGGGRRLGAAGWKEEEGWHVDSSEKGAAYFLYVMEALLRVGIRANTQSPFQPGHEIFQSVIITLRTKLGSEIKEFLPLCLSDFLHRWSHDLVPLTVIYRFVWGYANITAFIRTRVMTSML